MGFNDTSFSAALLWLKDGFTIKRSNWTGCLKLQIPDENSKMNQPYIYAICKDGEIVPATINMLDMLAEDWSLASPCKIPKVCGDFCMSKCL